MKKIWIFLFCLLFIGATQACHEAQQGKICGHPKNATCEKSRFVYKYFKPELDAENNNNPLSYSDKFHLKTSHAFDEYRRVMNEIAQHKKPSFPKTLERYLTKQKKAYLEKHSDKKNYIEKPKVGSQFLYEWSSAFAILKTMEAEFALAKLEREDQVKAVAILQKEFVPEQAKKDAVEEKSKTTPAVKKNKRVHRELKWV